MADFGISEAMMAMAAVSAASTAANIYTSSQQTRAQQKASQASLELAEQTAQNEEQARAKADQNQADVSGLLEANTGTVGTTALTGAMGEQVNKKNLSMGGSLLGSSNSLGG